MTYFQLQKQLEHLPKNEVNTLICHAHGITLPQLIMHRENEAESADTVLEYAERLEKGEPVQYITNKADFYGLEFFVDNRVLIPRFDTEALVEYCIENIPQDTVFADICCGSGCIGISILKNRPDLSCIFADISDGALQVCRQNAEALGVYKRSSFMSFDALDADCYLRLQNVTTVVSNPPYIRSCVIPTLDKQVLHEPLIALDGGDDGMDLYRAITKHSRSTLECVTHILYEIGYDQEKDITAVACENRYSCRVIRDLSGNCRVAVLD